MNAGGLFDGCGLLAYGLHLAGWEHAWLCERDEFRASLLELRFPDRPVYRDVRDVGADAARVDLIAGGFPCKGISVAGRGEGFGHPETALWREMLRVIRELRPRYVVVENVARLLTMRRGELFSEVLGGLASSGYDAEWDCFPAAAFGAPHGRDRVFVTAFAHPEFVARSQAGERVAGSGEGGEPTSRWQARTPIGRAAGRTREADAAADPERRGVGADGRVRRGAAGSEDQPAREALPAGAEVALAADAEQDHPGTAADAASVRRPGRSSGDGRRGERLEASERSEGVEVARDSGQAVEWGEYAAAVARWEAISGRAAPKPLLRRVDDGSAQRMDRPRLSALGDGVLVQAGWFVGRRILEYERERAAA